MRARLFIGLALAIGAAIALPTPALANAQQAGVQVALRALGLYLGPIDGDVGPQTVAAIRAAQVHFHLPVTGLADVRTRVALGPLGRPLFGERTLRRGDFGLDVSVLQYLLLQRGLYAGALDGFVGVRTEAAVRRYQRRAQLVPDGVVGPLTTAALVRETDVPVRAEPVAAVNVRGLLDTWSARAGVSRGLVRALAWMESGYQTDVVSAAGARGVMQTLPSTRSFVEDVLVGRPVPQTVDGDVEVGVLYLRHLLRLFDGDKRLALAAWYQGAGAVQKGAILPATTTFVDDVLALEARM